LSLATAFAGPLLDVIDDPSGGLHIHGHSQTGKTSLLRCAGSVYGPGDTSGPMRTWRATANGLEGVAAETSDGLLVLDEMGQASAREIDDTIYMLSNQAGKARAVWQNLHGKLAAGLSDHLRAASRSYFGTAGPAFLEKLAKDRSDE
jgi:uncharacterized protein (DUF927 family)